MDTGLIINLANDQNAAIKDAAFYTSLGLLLLYYIMIETLPMIDQAFQIRHHDCSHYLGHNSCFNSNHNSCHNSRTFCSNYWKKFCSEYSSFNLVLPNLGSIEPGLSNLDFDNHHCYTNYCYTNHNNQLRYSQLQYDKLRCGQRKCNKLRCGLSQSNKFRFDQIKYEIKCDNYSG